MTEDEMVGWHDQLHEYYFEQAPGVVEGQGSLTFCTPCGPKESDTTESPHLYKSHLYDGQSFESLNTHTYKPSEVSQGGSI